MFSIRPEGHFVAGLSRRAADERQCGYFSPPLHCPKIEIRLSYPLTFMRARSNDAKMVRINTIATEGFY
jgi:hypothetical protein